MSPRASSAARLLGLLALLSLASLSAHAKKKLPGGRASKNPTRASARRSSAPFYTYAIYNQQHLLVNDPIEVLREALDRVRTSSSPISDVFVVSHGWSYTAPEAISSYIPFIELIKNLQKGCGGVKDTQEKRRCEKRRCQLWSDKSHPYFIFIAWDSGAHPVADFAQAALPSDADRHFPAKQIAGLLDGIFLPPTAWKESENAASNALGDEISAHPDKFWGQAWDSAPYVGGPDGSKPDDGNQKNLGRNLPVSALLYELFRLKSTDRFRIHCVGHSYGAKLITLAAIEALNRLEYSSKDAALPSINPKAAIDALVDIDPAFQLGELEYSYSRKVNQSTRSAASSAQAFPPYHWYDLSGSTEDFRAVSALKLIKRKAIIYSKTDFAAGFWFDKSQFIFSNIVLDKETPILAWLHEQLPPPKSERGCAKALRTFGSALINGIIAPVFDVLAAAASPAVWSIRKLRQLPGDFIYHWRRNPSAYGVAFEKHPCWRPINALNFILPVDKLWTHAPLQERGLWRPAIPALGSTGLKGYTAGRDCGNLGKWCWLAKGHSALRLEQFAGLTGEGSKARTTFKMEDVLKCGRGHDESCRKLGPGIGNIQNWREQMDRQKGKYLYSFDASSIFDTWLSPEGSHGDFSSYKLASDHQPECPCVKSPYCRKKYEDTFEFVHDFTIF